MKVSNWKLIASLMCVSMIAPVVSARQLTADEALQAFMQQGPNIKKAPASSYSLVYTEKSPVTDVNGVYVFSRKDNSGFVLLAADDAIGELMLGYSDASTFDATNMPPALQEMLAYYAYCVGESSSSPMIRKAPQAKAPRADIAPICETTWNQDAPYNNQCPIVNGSRSVTGCVATAMAQVMKVHEWPLQGTGSKGSLNFSQITYDWGNMLNSYSGSYTDTEANAVATLMYSCGVAANMNYSPIASGTSDMDAAQALVANFNYDKGLRFLYESWFDDEKWDELLYSELVEGRPILMGGSNADEEGHEFVCDGYQSSSAYYHINWGWGGSCDGYFSLTNLEPDRVGTGGGSGSSGFNYKRSIVCGIQKPVENSTYVPILGMNHFLTNEETYAYNSSSSVTFDCPTCSYAIANITYSLGFKLVSKNRSVQYIDLKLAANLPTFDGIYFSGFSGFEVPSTDFPVGEYDVYFVYKTADTDWQEVYYDKSVGDASLHFNVTNSQINISAEAPVEYAHVTGIEFPYSNSDGTSEEDPAMLLSDVQNIKVSMDCVRSPWQGEVYLAFADQDGEIVAQSDTQNVSFSSVGETKDVRFSGPWGDLSKEIVYKMKVRSTDSGLTCGVYYVLISEMTGKVDILSEEEVEYYNLQGVKVTHPDRGLFLRKSGTRTEKVILK